MEDHKIVDEQDCTDITYLEQHVKQGSHPPVFLEQKENAEHDIAKQIKAPKGVE